MAPSDYGKPFMNWACWDLQEIQQRHSFSINWNSLNRKKASRSLTKLDVNKALLVFFMSITKQIGF